MAAITWFTRNEAVDGWQEMRNAGSPGADATSSPQTGWVVGTGATNHSEFATRTNRASSTFTGTTVPDGTLDLTLKDAWRSDTAFTGSFASANWNVHFAAVGVTQSGAQDGRIRIRLFRGANADGSSATQITAAQQNGGLITNLSTQQTSTVTWNPGAITVTNEYIFVQLAWERTGAGGMTTTDVAMRVGTTASRVISSDFTPGAQSATASAATATFTAIALSTTPGAVSATASPATATSSAQSPTATPGAVSATATAASGTAAALDIEAATSGAEAQSATAQTASATGTALAASAVAGLVSVSPEAASLSSTALGPTGVPGAVSVTTSPAAPIATALDVTASPGAVSAPAGAAVLTSTTLGPVATPGSVSATASPASMVAVVRDGSGAIVTIAGAGAAALSITALGPTVSPGPVAVIAEPAALLFAALGPSTDGGAEEEEIVSTGTGILRTGGTGVGTLRTGGTGSGILEEP